MVELSDVYSSVSVMLRPLGRKELCALLPTADHVLAGGIGIRMQELEEEEPIYESLKAVKATREELAALLEGATADYGTRRAVLRLLMEIK